MTPLEAMARAAWLDQFGDTYLWEDAPRVRQLEAIANMRAALLALAGAQLPRGTIRDGMSFYHDYDENIVTEEATQQCFSAMCLTIAREKPDEPETPL